MSSPEKRIYDITNNMFDELEKREVEIDEELATIVRACADELDKFKITHTPIEE